MATEALRPHIVLQGSSTTENFTTSPRGGTPATPVPAQDRPQHAASLRQQLAQVAAVQQEFIVEQAAANVQAAIGIQVEFESVVGVELVAESLARDSRGIELMNVREVDNRVLATVFVPEGKMPHFESLLTAYEEHRTDSIGRPRDGQRLIDAIRSVRVATFDALWTDSVDALPEDELQLVWWEAWLQMGRNQVRVVEDFRHLAELAGMQVLERALFFPERSVVLIHGSKAQLMASGVLLNAIAELRRAKNTAAFFDSLDPAEQASWEDDLVARLEFPQEAVDLTYVTLLDTGVNHGHALLAPFIEESDLHTVEPVWGVGDNHGHGTEQAGLALFGELGSALAEEAPLHVGHRLESVKLLPHAGGNEGESYGALTIEAVARAEVAAANRRRLFSMSVTAEDGRDRGRPSSWSASIDRLSSDYEYQGASPRLFVLSAGNALDSNAWPNYPDALATNGIQDPAQAWNALTVGAYSQLTNITEADGAGYQAIAPVNDLSPFTTTSVAWPSEWPFKPDVVMEGGNAGVDAEGFASTWSSLSLLTTYREPLLRSFSTTHATSAATALASKLGAEIWTAYPSFWPETVRAIMVHSARWTPAMLARYLGPQKTRASLTNLLRHCGYGVPSQTRALWSAANSLTLIVQDELQPYEKIGGKNPKTKDMHLHDLPWPREILEDLGDTDVTLRVTLSYFIEPNPGVRGSADKYAYQSHALRFAVRRPLETEAAFKARINARARDEEAGLPVQTVGDGGWFIGEMLRRRGSLLSDAWSGSAAELANRGQLAVFPTMGWWRNRPSLGRFDRRARYALVVSIEAPEVEQDLYAAVQAKIQQAVGIPINA